MLRVTEKSGVLELQAEGKLTRQDLEKFHPVFDRTAARLGRVPVLIDATKLEGYTASGLWADLKFDATHRDQLGPIAIIAERDWIKWATSASAPFFQKSVKNFEPDQVEVAREWLSTWEDD